MKVLHLLALGLLTNAYAKPTDKTAWAEYVDGQFVVKLKDGASLMNTVKVMNNGGLKLKKSINNSEHVVLLERDQAASLRSLGLDSRVSAKGLDRAIRRSLMNTQNFEYVEPNYVYRVSSYVNNGLVNMMGAAKQVARTTDAGGVVPNDPKFSELWGMQNLGAEDTDHTVGVAGADIDATAAWALGTGSKDIVVAVVDTGVDYTHPDLVDNIWSGANPNGDGSVIHGFNAITGSYDPMDDNEHGTHCSGTIGGVGNNGVGVAGVNWNVSIMGVKFLSGEGSGTLADAVKAIDWATAQDVDVMSNSWGGGGYSQALYDAIARANEKGIVFVAAAGNSSSDNDTQASYPASYEVPNVISVAAMTNTDALASFSSYGKRTVHVGAPGHNIVSTTPNNTYSSFSGTSMATPHVAGAVALFKSQRGANMNPTEIREEIMKTSERVASIRKKVAFGGSRLNLYNLLAGVEVAGPVVVPEDQWSAPVAQFIETAHPYADSFKSEWRVTQEGAKFTKLHFTSFDLENRYDTLTIVNAATGEVLDTISGTKGDFWTEQLDASDLILKFESDNSVNKTGFVMDGFSWSNFGS